MTIQLPKTNPSGRGYCGSLADTQVIAVLQDEGRRMAENPVGCETYNAAQELYNEAKNELHWRNLYDESMEYKAPPPAPPKPPRVPNPPLPMPPQHSLTYIKASDIEVPGQTDWIHDLSSCNDITWGDTDHTFVELGRIREYFEDESVWHDGCEPFLESTAGWPNETLVDLAT